MVCNNACKGKCLVEYKAFKCPKRDKYIIMKLNEHDEEILPREFNTQRGLTPRVKLLLNKLIFEYDTDPVVDTDHVVDTDLVIAHDASDITEEFLESIEDKTNTYYTNHRQAAIHKCLAITPPITSKPKAKPKLKVLKVSTESQRASTRTRKVVDKYGHNVGYDN